jgi:hypothetical protein
MTHDDDNRTVTFCGSYESLTSHQGDLLVLCHCLAESLYAAKFTLLVAIRVGWKS